MPVRSSQVGRVVSLCARNVPLMDEGDSPTSVRTVPACLQNGCCSRTAARLQIGSFSVDESTHRKYQSISVGSVHVTV